ncbi:TPA: hypothetical protein DDW35_11205, partial [Candidatus Sumerlaeota bacterium]|nr:hypothetical protein [Candidatus Sumerlaeota bacterium]
MLSSAEVLVAITDAAKRLLAAHQARTTRELKRIAVRKLEAGKIQNRRDEALEILGLFMSSTDDNK